jgi:hypothetical protein
MPRSYRASLTLDYTGGITNEYQYLIAALIQSGWTYIETSSLVLETEDRNEIWHGLQLVMKQDPHLSPLSALTFHVVGSESLMDGIPYPYSDAHPKALANVSGKVLP